METQMQPPATAAEGGNTNEPSGTTSGSQPRSPHEFTPELRRSSTGNLSNYSSFSSTPGGPGPGLRRTRTRQVCLDSLSTSTSLTTYMGLTRISLVFSVLNGFP